MFVNRFHILRLAIGRQTHYLILAGIHLETRIVREGGVQQSDLGQGNTLTPLWEIPFPHSIGLLYSAFTYYTGFKVNSGEYKVMGLAPYGEPKYVKAIYEHLLDLKPDGTFRLNMDYFNY